jgi:predicted neuraminidase
MTLKISRILLAGSLGAGGLMAALPAAQQRDKPVYRAELIAPLDAVHNHGSCVVQCPNGELLVCWYRGSGERKADDVLLLGARKRTGKADWSAPFVMGDTPGFPDCNPCMLVDPQGRLQLFWPVIVANEWHTALLMSKTSRKYTGAGAPEWSRERPILLKPGDEFTRKVEAAVLVDLARLSTFPEAQRGLVREYLERRRKNAGDRYFNRMGWMPRVHPLVLEGGRIVLPLYSDGFDFSLMAISDDQGETWHASEPIVGDGPVQPALVQRKDGTVVAFMRDNGLPPQRMPVSESRDRGETWSAPRDTEVLNPGSGVDAVRLRSGAWAAVYNDTERGRHSLAVSLSHDEGRTWRETRHLELDRSTDEPAQASYPSIIQSADGMIHVTYSFTAAKKDQRKDDQGKTLRETIKHAQLNEAWIQAGDAR